MLTLGFLIVIEALVLIAAPVCKNKPYNQAKEMAVQFSNVAFEYENSIVQAGSYLKCKINGKDWTATKMIPDIYPSEIVQIQGTNCMR